MPTTPEAPRTRRPNILMITADDMEGTTPGAFGGPEGVTPHLDRLAAQGAVFDRAHVAIAVCQPSRSAIMTGRWPHRNGAEGFEPIDDAAPLLTEQLAGEGYRLGILGKVAHLQPTERFGWSVAVDMGELGMGRDPQRYEDEMRRFLVEAGEQPWFLMLNTHDPHRPFHGAEDVGRFFDAQQQEGIPAPSRVFTADEVDSLPGYLPDLPEVRREYAQYLSSARRCDDVVGRVMHVLEEAGADESTLVLFLSDNGMAFPFSKANCYLQSTHTPFMVRWPGVVRPGRRVEQPFVSMLDLFATLCDAAGVQAPESDGDSLLPLFREETDVHRDHVVTVFHETSMRNRYEMRCLQDGEHGYIWNGWSGDVTYRAENMIGLTWPAMQQAAAHNEDIAARVRFYENRRTEELYDLAADPDALEDLSESSAHGAVMERMRERLMVWMDETGDPQLGAFRRSVGLAAAEDS